MIDPKRLQERFFRYVTCPSESGRERNMCLLLESELTALGLPVRREEIGGEIGSDGWNIYTRLEGGGEPLHDGLPRLHGRGITYDEQRDTYTVTIKAYEKLKQNYRISHEMMFD